MTRGKPLTLRHLTVLSRQLPECLALPWKTDACVPLHYSQDALPAPLHFPKIKGWAEKTRNKHRSASRLRLQVPNGLNLPT